MKYNFGISLLHKPSVT